MPDQALKLRELMGTRGKMRVYAVTSGKGGVGKTNVLLNLALAVALRNKRVAVLDADLGFANIDVLLGIAPRFSLYEVLQREKSLKEVMVEGPCGLKVIPGGSGIGEVVSLTGYRQRQLLEELKSLEREVEYLFVDTSAGLSRLTLALLLAADEVILVLNPEPPSLTDAYAVVKVFSHFRPQKEVLVVVNRAKGPREADQTFEKLATAARRFLAARLKYVGFVPDDPLVSQAVKRQQPFLLSSPHAAASRSLREIAASILLEGEPPQGAQGFISRLVWFLGGWRRHEP